VKPATCTIPNRAWARNRVVRLDKQDGFAAWPLPFQFTTERFQHALSAPTHSG
jgi:hypothetical protein